MAASRLVTGTYEAGLNFSSFSRSDGATSGIQHPDALNLVLGAKEGEKLTGGAMSENHQRSAALVVRCQLGPTVS